MTSLVIESVKREGSVIAIALPSGEVDRVVAEEILLKYDATDLNSYARQPLN